MLTISHDDHGMVLRVTAVVVIEHSPTIEDKRIGEAADARRDRSVLQQEGF